MCGVPPSPSTYFFPSQVSCSVVCLAQLASLSVRVLCMPRLINPRCVLPSKSPSLRLTCATMMAFLSPIVTKRLLYQQHAELFSVNFILIHVANVSHVLSLPRYSPSKHLLMEPVFFNRHFFFNVLLISIRHRVDQTFFLQN